MKKPLIFGGTILGFLITAALVIFIFFPGLPTYLKVKYKYDHINETVAEFKKTDIPSDHVSHTLKGVKFRIPSDWEGHSPIEGTEASSYASGEDSRIFVLDTDYKENEERQSEYKELLGDEYSEDDLYDPWAYFKYKEADYRHFYKEIGVDLPQYGLAYTMVFYTRDCLTAKKCLKLRGKDKDVFLDLAEDKEEAVGMEKMWKIKNSEYTAYVVQVLYGDYSGNTWDVNIFPNSNKNEVYTVTLKCPDETTAKQIISSIELE